ncbi:alkylhydroperoxidase family enzyme [Nocardioides massiliensis]|uniref:Alkylhydroperoxidase family enzyme n=2 Tax=Nocardioides massiliensis TaxID=1325935 RepID=A0ABT9NK16_9ACTN|nr:carboxymuconolactone decarboxylase family protein [Nocardioides massiliensis]MDP9820762.1 alkylhydroperoxidase family enzyme [Nocardioides massiliensis]
MPAELGAEINGRLAARTLSSTLPVQIWARRPEAATAWVRLLATLNEGAILDERLRELVRLRIASFTQCRTCQIGRKSDTVSEQDIACLSSDDESFTPREQVALRYADNFSADWFAVDDATYRELAEHFTVEEIVELQMFSAMMLAGGRLALVQRAWVDDEVEPVLGV